MSVDPHLQTSENMMDPDSPDASSIQEKDNMAT